MYQVSDEYKEAVAQLDREFKLQVQIYLRDKTILTLGEDEVIQNDPDDFSSDGYVKGDLKIESQMMSGGASSNTIDIGAVPSKKLSMTVYSPTTDLHVFSGASLWIYVSLLLPSGAWEPVPMGKFYINGASISREGNWVSFTAYDGMLKLQYELTTQIRAALKGKTAMEAAHILCEGLLLVSTAVSPAGGYVECPNTDLPLDFDSEQIETARDGIMWIAQLMGCFARVNRLGVLEFVPIMSWWEMYDETTGTILAVRNIQGNVRFKTKFSDDRIHIVGVAMRSEDNKLITRKYDYAEVEGGDPTSDVIVELEKNPLIMSSDKPLADILDAILAQVSTAYFYAFSAEIDNDPALDAGDTIRLQGGTINGTNKNNDLIGFITHSTWVYKKKQTVTNASSVPIVYEDTAAIEPAVMSEGQQNAAPARARARVASARSSDERNYLPPKPQSEKALQGKDSVNKLLGSNGRVMQFSDKFYLSDQINPAGVKITGSDPYGWGEKGMTYETFITPGQTSIMTNEYYNGKLVARSRITAIGSGSPRCGFVVSSQHWAENMINLKDEVVLASVTGTGKILFSWQETGVGVQPNKSHPPIEIESKADGVYINGQKVAGLKS